MKQVFSSERKLTKQTLPTSQSASRLKSLIALQAREQRSLQAREKELSLLIADLEKKKSELEKKESLKKLNLKKRILSLYLDSGKETDLLSSREVEKIRSYQRFLLKKQSKTISTEMGAMNEAKTDLDKLHEKITEEKEYLEAMRLELRDQETLLSLSLALNEEAKHRGLSPEAKAKIENYEKMREAKNEVDSLVLKIAARDEIEKISETMVSGKFLNLKGTLPLPVSGKTRPLGGARRGLEISSQPRTTVKSVFAGKVAFSGKLPGFGNVVLIDHGAHYFSLTSQLGEGLKKTGDYISANEIVGKTDDAGSPVGFEIRFRNLALDPLQWVQASGKFLR